MNLIHSGLLLVLFAIVEAINGLTPDKLNPSSQSQDLHDVPTVTEKPQQDSTVKIVVPPVSQIVISQTTEDNKPSPVTTTSTSTTTIPPPTTGAPTTPPTTTAPPPTPVIPDGPWVIRDNVTKNVCIIANMSMQLNITYPGKTKPQEYAVLNIPRNSTVDGSCSKPSQSMTIHWGPGHWLQVNFNENKTTKNFYVSGLSLNVNATVFKDAKDENNTFWQFLNKSSEFTTPLNMSYKCNRVQNLDLKGSDEKLKAVLSLKDAQLEAFVNKTAVNFGAAQNCDTFDTPDIVPIAVGCALAILVLVVLVAYLIGRKRSQNRGYLSM